MDTCPHCGKHLGKGAERLVFSAEHRPVRDWFAWNTVLRVAVPALALALLIAVSGTAAADGEAGVANLLEQGLGGTLLWIFAVLLAVTGVTLFIQGPETVCCALDREGAHLTVYLRSPGTLRLWARLTTKKTVLGQQADAPAPTPERLIFFRRADLRWTDVKRVQFWPQARIALLYRPCWCRRAKKDKVSPRKGKNASNP